MRFHVRRWAAALVLTLLPPASIVVAFVLTQGVHVTADEDVSTAIWIVAIAAALAASAAWLGPAAVGGRGRAVLAMTAAVLATWVGVGAWYAEALLHYCGGSAAPSSVVLLGLYVPACLVGFRDRRRAVWAWPAVAALVVTLALGVLVGFGTPHYCET